jgi:hypothetical protein
MNLRILAPFGNSVDNFDGERSNFGLAHISRSVSERGEASSDRSTNSDEGIGYQPAGEMVRPDMAFAEARLASAEVAAIARF